MSGWATNQFNTAWPQGHVAATYLVLLILHFGASHVKLRSVCLGGPAGANRDNIAMVPFARHRFLMLAAAVWAVGVRRVSCWRPFCPLDQPTHLCPATVACSDSLSIRCPDR